MQQNTATKKPGNQARPLILYEQAHTMAAMAITARITVLTVLLITMIFYFVAGAGLEPATRCLWNTYATNCFHPAILPPDGGATELTTKL